MTVSLCSNRSQPIASVICIVAIAIFAGCKGEPEPQKAAPAVAADPRPDVLAAGDVCAEDGRWKPCTIMERLERAGVTPKPIETDTTRVPYLTPIGFHYRVGKGGLLIAFYYQDSVQAKAEWAKLDTLRLVPRGDSVTPWPGKPSTIRAANLVAAFFGANAPQIERVQLMFQGGLPAPRP